LTPHLPIPKKPSMNKLRISLALLSMVTIAGVMPARANQPEMEAALANLRSAKGHLEHALHNKGGERVDAIEHINRAIRSVERGIANGGG
jgi:hypothetical protein